MENRNNGQFEFAILTVPDVTHVQSFHFKEQLSEPFVLTVCIVSRTKMNMKDVTQRESLLTIRSNDKNRLIHGLINNFTLIGHSGQFYTYEMTVVPAFWLLSFNKNYRIFQNLSTIDIVKEVLRENNFLSDSFVFRLIHKYQKRRYCTQYGESDFHFICRILEEEGIFFFFEHSESAHILVFSDTQVVYSPISGDPEIGIHQDSGLVADEETIQTFAYNRTICPGSVTHSNYNFKRPTLDMEVTARAKTPSRLEVYEFPGDYALPQQGSARVKRHLEELKSLEESAQGTSNCARFVPGSTFTLCGHDFDELNKEYCLISVEHEGAQEGVYGELSGIGGEYTYSNHFIAVPASVVYRTRKTVPKPVIGGVQSAVVTGPPGEEIHTDEYGRVKVRFHWDRGGEPDDTSSCWLRISQPWSGQAWGSISLPRVGDEVVVAFMNGDPDRPVIIGSVNNADSPPLYPLPEQRSQSGIRTRSYPDGSPDNFHELRFEDRKGKEEIYLRSERDWNIFVKNDKTQKVEHDEELHVGNNRFTSVGTDQVERVGGNHSVTARKIVLEAAGEIVLKCGSATVSLNSNGEVHVQGTKISLN